MTEKTNEKDTKPPFGQVTVVIKMKEMQVQFRRNELKIRL